MDYHNKNKSSAAITAIAEALKPLRPTVTEQDVEKLMGLRSTYAQEQVLVTSPWMGEYEASLEEYEVDDAGVPSPTSGQSDMAQIGLLRPKIPSTSGTQKRRVTDCMSNSPKCMKQQAQVDAEIKVLKNVTSIENFSSLYRPQRDNPPTTADDHMVQFIASQLK